MDQVPYSNSIRDNNLIYELRGKAAHFWSCASRSLGITQASDSLESKARAQFQLRTLARSSAREGLGGGRGGEGGAFFLSVYSPCAENIITATSKRRVILHVRLRPLTRARVSRGKRTRLLATRRRSAEMTFLWGRYPVGAKPETRGAARCQFRSLRNHHRLRFLEHRHLGTQAVRLAIRSSSRSAPLMLVFRTLCTFRFDMYARWHSAFARIRRFRRGGIASDIYQARS